MMPRDQTSYLVFRPDEVRGFGSGASSHIPSLGAETSAIDQYRIAGVHLTNLPELGGAFTDVKASAALAKVAEGGISTHRELEAAETALQALLLHEIVHVITHAPKVDRGNGLVTYARQDIGRRSPLAFQLMNLAESRDLIIAPELLKIDNGRVISSSLPKSSLVGVMEHQLVQGTPYWNEDVEDAIHAAIDMHGVPAYLAETNLQSSHRRNSFAEHFYRRLRQPWDAATKNIPEIVWSFSTPPLLAIVLYRMNNRSELLSVLTDLRRELAPARRELLEFNQIVTASAPQAEVEYRIRRINESFDAIVPESKLTKVHRRQRKILSFQKLLRPLWRLATANMTKSGATFEDAMSAAGGINQAVQENQALVNRTVTARTFGVSEI
jgi:hypothetical protein